MKKILTIAKWEFIERVKRKSFIISMLLMPALIIAFTLIPSQLIDNRNDIPLPIAVVDLTGKYQAEFSNELVQFFLPDGQPTFLVLNFNSNYSKFSKEQSVKWYADKQVLSNGIAGYVLVEENPKLKLTFRTNEILDLDKLSLIEKAFNKVSVRVNAQKLGIDPNTTKLLTDKITRMKRSFIEANSEEDIFKTIINSYIFIILLITMVLFSGGMFVRGLVLEKSNRIIELILSSCTSKELLFGKVLGLSFFGLFQFLIWILIGIFLHRTNTIDLSTIHNIQYQLLFFILGYIFYSAIFIGLGAIVNFDHEAQQLTGYLSIILIFPIVIAVEIIRAPNSILSLFLSYFPFTSAQVMLLRLNSTKPGIIEVGSVILVMVFSIYLIILASAKLFKVGILNSGTKLTIRQIINWLKLK